MDVSLSELRELVMDREAWRAAIQSDWTDWTEVDIVQEVVTETIPKKKKRKEAKWLSEEALQIAEKRREAKGKEKRKDIPIWMQSSK